MSSYCIKNIKKRDFWIKNSGLFFCVHFLKPVLAQKCVYSFAILFFNYLTMKKEQSENALITTTNNKISENTPNKKDVKKDYNRLLDLVLTLNEMKK